MATATYASTMPAVSDLVARRADSALAERGTRLGAALLDGIAMAVMVYAPAFVGAIVGSAFSGGNGDPTAAIGGGLLLGAIGFVAWTALTISYVKRNGQSIGKKWLGIKVERTDGAAATLGRIFWLRNVVNALICLVPFYGLIDILFIFSDSRQCLHDRLADTVVVQA